MTLRLSPAQLSIVNFLKAPSTSPEDYAKARGVTVSTVWVQLHRIRRKDKDARIFHAMFNGLMGANPNLRQYFKIVEGLTPVEQQEAERRLQIPSQGGRGNHPQRKRVKERRHPARGKSQGYRPKRGQSGRTGRCKG